MTFTATSDAELRERLRAAGLRITGVRLGILRVLGATRVGLDAQEVATKLDSSTTDRVTVYRTLNALVDKGLAHRVDPGDRVFRFRLSAGDAHAHESGGHPHFVCDACGSVECLNDAEVVLQSKPAPADAKPSPARARRFKVVEQNVTLHGVCETCDEHPPAPKAGGHTPSTTKRPRRRA